MAMSSSIKLSSAFTRAWNRHWLHYNPVLNMNEKVTTSYTIAHTVSGTVLVRLTKTTFRGANSETSIAFRCYSLPSYTHCLRDITAAAPNFFKSYTKGIEHTLRLGTESSYPLFYCIPPWIKQRFMYTLMQRGLDRNRRALLYSIPRNRELPGLRLRIKNISNSKVLFTFTTTTY